MELPIILIFITILLFFIALYLTYKLAKYKTDLKWHSQLSSLRHQIANQQRAGIKGKVAETFAPFLEGFPFKASECKFIGDPIDYIAFEGLNDEEIKSIHLIEVKEGSSKLSKVQKQIKDAVKDKKVNFEEFRFNADEEILEEE